MKVWIWQVVAGSALAALWGCQQEVSSLAQSAEPAYVVDSLLPDQSESGLVTQRELDLAEKWLTAVTDTGAGKPEWVEEWLGTALPFSFQYGGKPSAGLLKTWRLQVGEPKVGREAIERELTWDDRETGLRVVWQLKRFVNYPAIVRCCISRIEAVPIHRFWKIFRHLTCASNILRKFNLTRCTALSAGGSYPTT